jgi:hypothetical protein
MALVPKRGARVTMEDAIYLPMLDLFRKKRLDGGFLKQGTRHCYVPLTQQ